jgi:hypothetical protein
MTLKQWADTPAAREDLQKVIGHPIFQKALESLRKHYLPRPLPEPSMTEDQQRGLAALYNMHAGFYAALNALENLPNFKLAELPPAIPPWGEFLPETEAPIKPNARRRTAAK